jgi:hypothetical protein
VFSPGLYSISVDTPVSSSPGVAVLSDTPQAEVPVDIQTQPTSTFVDVVQERVESFLTACTTQQVLQPTGCPFGLQVQNRILEPRCGRWRTSPRSPCSPTAPDGRSFPRMPRRTWSSTSSRSSTAR